MAQLISGYLSIRKIFMNAVFIIIETNQPSKELRETRYISFTYNNLLNFISKLKEKRFDIKKIDIYISEE